MKRTMRSIDKMIQEIEGFRFEVGDIVEAQGAKLKIIHRERIGLKRVYQAISPFTTGRPWIIEESFLSTARKLRTKKL